MFYSVALLQTLKDNQIEDISLKLLHVHTEHCKERNKKQEVLVITHFNWNRDSLINTCMLCFNKKRLMINCN